MSDGDNRSFTARAYPGVALPMLAVAERLSAAERGD
jgi:hypothetical protein